MEHKTTFSKLSTNIDVPFLTFCLLFVLLALRNIVTGVNKNIRLFCVLQQQQYVWSQKYWIVIMQTIAIIIFSLQMLAMNRGEHQGVLSVKVAIPDNTYVHFFNYCQQKWLGMAPPHYYRTQLVMMSIEDSWERLGGFLCVNFFLNLISPERVVFISPLNLLYIFTVLQCQSSECILL